jgi:hypothetical protein
MATSRTSRFNFETLAAFGVFALAAACAPESSNTTDAGQFVAVPSDFCSYPSWTSYDLGGDDGGTAGDACAHVANVPRVAFMNQAPAHGSTEFPVGTIIVKQIKSGADPSQWSVFGMVKRGGGFNPGSGCEGWEWYGLTSPDGGCPGVQWSGTEPGAGEVYASCGPCAGCHSAAQNNDCVLAPELSLSQW